MVEFPGKNAEYLLTTVSVPFFSSEQSQVFKHQRCPMIFNHFSL
jgi:hypothetical protein